MKNKVVWITGASSGIGEALVYAYNKLGAKLVGFNMIGLLQLGKLCIVFS